MYKTPITQTHKWIFQTYPKARGLLNLEFRFFVIPDFFLTIHLILI